MNWRDGEAAKKWIPIINAAEDVHGIPRDLAARQIYTESRFDPKASNPSGAIGIAQLLPQFFAGAGRDPVKDVGTAAAYLASLAKRFGGDWQLGLAAYDFGPGALNNLLKKGGCTFCQLPKETQNYVSGIVADVPVPGVLCKIQSLPQVGSPIAPSSAVPPSVSPSPKSSWLSAINIFKSRSVQSLPVPLPPSVPLRPAISSPIVKPEVSMSVVNPTAPAPSPALVAASPFLKAVLTSLKTAVSTTLTGDPAQIALRAGPAFNIFLSQVVLLEPSLVAAETGVVNQDISAKIDGVIAKLP